MTENSTKREITVDGCRVDVWKAGGKVMAKADECEAASFPINTPFEDAAVRYLSGA